jgi:hypothetical protein
MKMNMDTPLSPGTVLEELPPRASRTMRYKALMDAAPGSWVVLAVNGTRSANMANCAWVRETPGLYQFAERSIGGERHLIGQRAR